MIVQLSEGSRVGLSGMLALVATYAFGRQAFGLFVPVFREEFGLSLDVLGYYASGAQAGYLVATIATGIATARYGPRVPVVTGSLLLALGAALMASAPGPVLLAVGVIAAGTSAGGAWAPFSDAVATKVPAAQTPRALSLVNAGSPVGLVVAGSFVLVAGDRWRAVWWAFAAIGLVAAAASFRVLVPERVVRSSSQQRLALRWFVNGRSMRMLVVAFGISVTCGVYFAYAPVMAQDGGLEAWIGAAMWVTLGLVGVAVGTFGGDLVTRHGIRGPLALMSVAVGGSVLMLLLWPGYVTVALGSSALFGVGFTAAFALLVMWSQQVYRDRPSSGFTLAIMCIAAGFILGPSLFGVVASNLGGDVALMVAAAPALLVALIPPARDDRPDRRVGQQPTGTVRAAATRRHEADRRLPALRSRARVPASRSLQDR